MEDRGEVEGGAGGRWKGEVWGGPGGSGGGRTTTEEVSPVDLGVLANLPKLRIHGKNGMHV